MSGFRSSAIVGLALLFACSADTGQSGRSGSGSSSGDGSGGSGAGAGGSDAFGNSDMRTSGMAGGAGGATAIIGDGSCTAEGSEAEVGRQGTDIVWVVDNSCSMAVEAVAVQTNMNRFTQLLSDRGIDVHLVLISSANTSYQMNSACPPNDFVCALGMLIGGFIDFGVCIGAPFGSGTCPNDSVAPHFQHMALPVGSTNGLQMMLDLYPMYANMLRPTTSKHFVIVTDDESQVPAATFTQQMTAKDPTLLADWDFHGIFAQTQCADAAAVGTVYQELVTQTGGVAGDLCLQQFDPVFDQLAMDVAMKADFACDWPIPAAPPGQTLDPALVNVRYTEPGGSVVNLGKIPAGEDCAGREGWYYDDDDLPTTVHSCPASCDVFRATGGKVDVLFGCASVVVE